MCNQGSRYRNLLLTALVSVLGLQVGCGGMEADDTATETGAIDEVVITIERSRPCLGCAVGAGQAAAAAAQAQLEAMARAEARARALRQATVQRITACMVARDNTIEACQGGFHQVAARAAGERANCLARQSCRASSPSGATNTCTTQGTISCTDNQNWCIAGIPPGTPPAIAGQAHGNCASANAQCVVSATRGCAGAGNFNGAGSATALCSRYNSGNCSEPEQQTRARGFIALANCLAGAKSTADACMAMRI